LIVGSSSRGSGHALLGAITGGLIGLATETGVVRGTGVGGITGLLVSMEVVDSSLAIWRSDELPAIWSVVYVVGSRTTDARYPIHSSLAGLQLIRLPWLG
jgi:hypothetical protein